MDNLKLLNNVRKIDGIELNMNKHTEDIKDLSSQMEHKASKLEVFLKENGININDFDEETRQTFLEAQGIDVNYILGEGNVKPINTTFFNYKKDYFKDIAWTQGQISTTDGKTIVNSASRHHTTLIPITLQKYIFNKPYDRLFLYDENEDMLLYSVSSNTEYEVTHSSAKYIRIVSLTENYAGMTMTVENAKDEIKDEYIPINDIKENIKNSGEFATIGDNTDYISSITWTQGTLSSSDGTTIIPSATKYHTDFLTLPNGTYELNYTPTYVFYYDENNNMIKYTAGKEIIVSNQKIKIVMASEYYQACTLMSSNKDKINLDLIPIDGIKNEISSSYQTDVVLPREIQVLADNEFTIYYNNIIKGFNTRDAYEFVGFYNDNDNYRFNDRVVYVPSETTADRLVQFGVKFVNPIQPTIWKNFSLKVVPKSNGQGLTKKVMFIGDSLTAKGAYTQELLNLFENDSMKIELLGGQGSGLNQHEGRVGWRAWDYCNLATGEYGYTGANAFYNPNTNTFDFEYYMNQKGYSDVDIVGICLGTNDLVRDHNNDIETDMMASYRKIIASIKAFNPNIKIMIWLTPLKASMNYSNRYLVDARIEVIKRLIKEYDSRENENIFVVPVYCNINPQEDYPFKEVIINKRLGTVAKINTDNTHLNEETGYPHIADVFYSYIKYIGAK